MSKHIGIVACSAEGAALCYRTICVEAEEQMGRHLHPEISMHTYPLGAYTRYFDYQEWDKVADLMVDSTKKLQSAGAEFVICPDNTIHQAMPYVQEKSPLPWLHIAEEVVREAKRNGYSKLGVLGTRYLMEGPVYKDMAHQYGLQVHIPNEDERSQINNVIFQELVYGRCIEPSRQRFYEIIHHLKVAGCGAVVLGCTEIPLLVEEDDSPLPTLDSTRILARAALKESIGLEG